MSEIGREIEDYFCKFTFGQFVTLAILELATLFFVFYLGARYGPELLGTHAIQSAEVATILPQEEPKSVKEITAAEEYKYTFPEILTDQKGGGPAVSAPPPPTIPDDEKAPVTEHAVRVKQSELSKYVIQIGSFPTPEEASGVISSWQEKGYDAFMSIGKLPGRGTWYRVRIGGFGDKDTAKKFLDDMKKKEKVDAIIVPTQS